MEILYKSTQIGELKDADEKSGIVTGYGSVFGNIDSDARSLYLTFPSIRSER